jgi:hypothetical protein
MPIDAILNSIMTGLFGSTPPLIGPSGGMLFIDVLEGESPEYSNEISSNPVECGTDITDHVYKKPTSVTLDCIFTDPLLAISNLANLITAGPMALAPWRVKKTALYAMFEKGDLVNITTPLHCYLNYIIESISPTTSATSGDCFRCRIVARDIRIVASAVGYIDPLLLPSDMLSAGPADATDATKPKNNKGPAKTNDADAAPTKSANKSVGNTKDAYAYGASHRGV